MISLIITGPNYLRAQTAEELRLSRNCCWQ